MTKNKRKIPTLVLMTAIVSIAGLELAAIYAGIDGTLFSIALAAIAGIAGWTMPQLKIK